MTATTHHSYIQLSRDQRIQPGDIMTHADYSHEEIITPGMAESAYTVERLQAMVSSPIRVTRLVEIEARNGQE